MRRAKESTRRIAAPDDRLRVLGKGFHAGGEKVVLRGATYGGFAPGPDGAPFPSPAVVAEDFDAMAAAGINCVRTYDTPPRWILDAAQARGLRVLVGLAWHQHVAFLDMPGHARQIQRRVSDAVRAVAGHPAIAAYAVGNEIPAGIVRWHGARRVEAFIHRLYRTVKREDPDALVTYVNYPGTEYLRLGFLDFASFNVFLELHDAMAAYLMRLQNLTGDKPLVITELGLDSRRNDAQEQARLVSRQLDIGFQAGCGGMFVFAWTDEWVRGGAVIEDWDFGLVDRDRTPKPALAAVSDAFARVDDARTPEPPATIVVCTYNGERTLADCLEAACDQAYDRYEVVVVDDGSTDATSEVATRYPVRLLQTANNGLSSARNVGWRAARFGIVAFVDDDARPDPNWLRRLVDTLERTPHGGVGGPNLPPPDDGAVAECVAAAPGGPVHVLLDDERAEHIPGCNMAFRRSVLEGVGGFDDRFRIAGDDVDFCWRVQEAGYTIGFDPAAVVWHRRRDTVRGYLRQQFEYGRAEAQLEQKWPRRFNVAGHLSWAGRVYGGTSGPTSGRRRSIKYGAWGSGLFQSVYDASPSFAGTVRSLPEVYLLMALLAALSALGSLWAPLLAALPLLVALGSGLVVASAAGAARAPLGRRGRRAPTEGLLRLLTFSLFVLQPLVRLLGRLRGGLSPWRRKRGGARLATPFPRRAQIWSERWRPLPAWLEAMEHAIADLGAVVVRGGAFDRWDLQIRGGLLGSARVLAALEEHGQGRQLLRLRLVPRIPGTSLFLMALLAVLAGAAALDGAPAFVVASLGSAAAAFAIVTLVDVGAALGIARVAIAAQSRSEQAALGTAAGSNGGREELGSLHALGPEPSAGRKATRVDCEIPTSKRVSR